MVISIGMMLNTALSERLREAPSSTYLGKWTKLDVVVGQIGKAAAVQGSGERIIPYLKPATPQTFMRQLR